MIYKSAGIFLKKIQYGDTSLIVKIYTQKFGLQSYLLKGARSKKGKQKSNLLQHLALLDMEVYHRESKNLQTIKDYGLQRHFKTIPYNMVKSSIIMFMNEVLLLSIKEEEPNDSLFEFLKDSLIFLDELRVNISVFHLVFMVQLTRYLGFHPQGTYNEQHPLFDMMGGVFTSVRETHPYVLEGRMARLFSSLKEMEPGEVFDEKLLSGERNQLLKILTDYYRLHVPNFERLNSLEILHQIFKD
jgi:DNA repair protein RecO (recombination protein O)